MGIVTRAYGGDGGSTFQIESVLEVGLRTGNEVDALLLNSTRRGGNGGRESVTLTLAQDEYISEVTVRHGKRIDNLELKTNANRVVSGGGGGGGKSELKNIRVLGLGGKSGNRLDKLRIKYISNYVPSELQGNRETVVISIIAPGETVETFESSSVRTLNAIRRVSETTFSSETSVSAEFVAKATFSASQSTSITATSLTELNEEIEKVEDQSKTITRQPTESEVGLETTQAEVFLSPDGIFWLFPSGGTEYIEVPRDEGVKENVVDLTGVLSAQIPAMLKHKGTKFGFDYYDIEG